MKKRFEHTSFAACLTALVLLPGYSELAPASASAATAPPFTYLSEAVAGKTNRYWDCCKGSASWSGKAPVNAPATSCAKDGVTKLASNAQSGCNGGTSYMCNSFQPWAINTTLSYGYAAANIAGKTESDIDCACYALQFTSTTAVGKTLVVQVLNLGSDVSANQFSLLIPGGGVGIFNGCQPQFGAPSEGWGARYGGISSQAQCSQLPSVLQPGCNWRFAWFQNADNPTVSFRRIKCPAEITAKSGCKRNDD